MMISICATNRLCLQKTDALLLAHGLRQSSRYG